MKTLIKIAVLIIFTNNQLNAQDNSHLNYIEYQTTLVLKDGTVMIPYHVKLWYNDTVCYNMRWGISSIHLLNKHGLPYNKQDSIDNYKTLEYFAQAYKQQKNTTRCINANKDSSIYVMDYDMDKVNPYYYKTDNNKNYLSNIVLIQDTTKLILGKQCKLAIGTYTYPNDSTNTQQVRIWYATDIKAPFGPDYLIKGLPGLVMEMDGGEIRYKALNIEVPAKITASFDFDITTIKFHTKEEFIKKYAEYNQQYLKEIDKQRKENEKKEQH